MPHFWQLAPPSQAQVHALVTVPLLLADCPLTSVWRVQLVLLGKGSHRLYHAPVSATTIGLPRCSANLV